MSRRSRQSKRRVNSIMSLLFLSAILLIASTYAWFSANRVVTINTITAKVTAAEGIQISLDGEKWSSTIEVNEENLAAAKAKTISDGGTALVYSLPDELNPVSTTGELSGGKLVIKAGDISADGDVLDTIAEQTDGAVDSKYICFDVFLKNSSSQTYDDLYFNTGTNVAITVGDTAETSGVNGTGLENSVRAAFVLYDNTAVLTASGADIRGMAAGTNPLVAIWEPNNAKHIAEVVENDDRVASATSAFTTYTLNAAAPGTIYQVNTPDGKYYAADTEHGLTSGSAITGLSHPTTIGTEGELTAKTAVVSSVDSDTEGATPTQLQLKGNAIMKMRVYLYLEGQDPDCNDTASTGRLIDFSIAFTKLTEEEIAALGG